MKRRVASALLVLGLLATSTSPADAIFGLSKCDKAKKQITNEERIGLLLHKDYLVQKKIVLKQSNPTINDLGNALSWLPDVYDSDLRLFKIVDKNSSCFSSEQIARARSESRTAKKNISDITTIRNLLIKNPQGGKNPLSQEQINILRDWYSSYYAFLTNKKLN